LARIGGFDMAFGLFNFHVDNDGVAELISISDLTLPAADPSTPPAVGAVPSTTTPLMPSEEEPRLETSTPSVGSNDFQDPPPSPPLIASSATLITSWVPETSHLTRSPAAKTLGGHCCHLPNDIQMQMGSQCPHTSSYAL
jgi:hypothetical protein